MTELGSIYKAARERVTALVAEASEGEVQQTTPACPEWTVHNIVSHLAGVCEDVVTGNIEGVASDPWTAAQVDKRRDRSTAEVLAEWAELAAQVEPIVQFFPGRVGEQFVYDMCTHEHDIRHALGKPGAQDSEAVDVGVRFTVEVGFLSGIAARSLPALEIVAGDHRWVAGGFDFGLEDEHDIQGAVLAKAAEVLTGGGAPMEAETEPAGSLKVSPFDLMRALGGRRSRSQIAAWDWSLDPTPYLPAFEFGPFKTRDEPLED